MGKIFRQTNPDLTRRELLWIASMSAVGLTIGCAVNPVTGRSQFMLVSEDSEIQIDKQNSPHQFSADYGPLQDTGLNNYIQRVGRKMAGKTHRSYMPYSFRGVNATYINAYAFPGGSIAATRGILLKLGSEAEFAALLGHEMGHVNARHTARQMSLGMMTQALVGGVSVYAGSRSASLGKLASSLGMIGTGALLASYSRDNEREADALGMEYMVQTGYGTDGFVGLMDILNNMAHRKTSAAEMLFATHPMSAERYNQAVQSAKRQYAAAEKYPVYRERYMDHTAGLRKIKGVIEDLQKGEKEMGARQYEAAGSFFEKALKKAPSDYAGLLMMAKCQLVLKNNARAVRYAEKARGIYPREAQACHILGYAMIRKEKYDAALEEFAAYDQLLPGNPNTIFFKGLALEGMQKIEPSAENYHRYLKIVSQGAQARHAYQRLVEWGYIKSQS
ncbi:MAG: M48 family metalloprotease [Deltaproteobacteria bacterium]|nr:M48 family metalloprotease [Deltaproteobacteria bacterium]